MGAAIWSAPVADMMDFPAENFVAFFSNHRLLQYDRPVWRTVKGGSHRYVEKLTAAFADRLRLGCAVTSVERTPHGVVVHDSHGNRDCYDHVVIASHSDQALAMLSDADPRERSVLGAIGYAPNTVYLHRDPNLMPKRQRAWASWNFLRWQRQASVDGSVDNDVAVTYWMNQLQGIDTTSRCSSASTRRLRRQPELTFGKYRCEHPAIQRRRLCCPEAAGGHPGPASYLVLRRLDRIRLSRGRITIRARGRRSARRGGAVARTAARNWHKPRSSDVEANRRNPNPMTSPRVAAALYLGRVMHARLKPIGHRFSYRVMCLLIDLDRLEAANRQSRLFGVNRAALYSFHEADHGERDGSPLRLYAQRCAAERGIDLTGGRVLLLCYPRLLGYTFNPLSVYFCYRADGELALLIYEVRNTFGDIHALRAGREARRHQRGRGPASARQGYFTSRRSSR